MKYFGAKLIRQTSASNFNGTSYTWFRYGEITDLAKFLKKPQCSTKLMQHNYSYLKVLKLIKSFFLVCFFVPS